ncbi:hypothetical protein [Mucilaginibacter lacusdianchii]|uniref:hypothetical protein n=1 Tax=Mucilaginibacter lacusdianchii TaxID=2684211 RepID=UPI00131B75CB|nr:hypothetical protein [Mucilaginibacter sp. JXJ CY 39]
MNTTKKQNNKVNKSLAVAITSLPARPSLARAQQRAFTLLFISFICLFNKSTSQNNLDKKESAFSFFR